LELNTGNVDSINDPVGYTDLATRIRRYTEDLLVNEHGLCESPPEDWIAESF